jgi:hypothetical protein
VARSEVTYICSHHSAPVAAMSSKREPALLETTMSEPAPATARAIASSPSGCAARWSVVGATAKGVLTGVPSSEVPVCTWVTSRST